MKVVIAGGTGYLGELLTNHFSKDAENTVYILSRGQKAATGNIHYLQWDAKTVGSWATALENADLLINLTGKSINCRYTEKNKALIYSSRVDSTTILCKAVQQLANPPKVFMQSSAVTVYGYSDTELMTEDNPPVSIDFSTDVCKKWEDTFNAFDLPKTKKIITRISIVLGENGGAFPVLKRLAKLGLGGKQGSGNQYISFITEQDYVKAITFLMHQEAGAYNLCVPNPIKNKDFQKVLRQKVGAFIGIPTPAFLLKIGAFFIGTEPELVLKSRKVYPKKLLENGFTFTTDSFEKFTIK